MRTEKQVLFWSAVAVVAFLVIILLQDILLPFVAGMGIAYFLNPLAGRLEQIGLPRVLASILIVLFGAVLIGLLLVFVVPLLVEQVRQLAVAAPGELQNIRNIVEGWARERLGDQFPAFQKGLEQAVSGLSENWSAMAAKFAQSIWSQGLAIVNFISLFLVTPVVVFYLLVDWHPMLNRIDGWLPRDHAAVIRQLGSDVNDAVSAFIRGQGTICLILGVIYALGLTWIGVKYGLLIGLGAGLLGFVPFVGWALGILTSSAMALTQFWPDTVPLLKVLALFGFGQALDAGFLSPKIVGSKVGLHPVWLIFSLFVFSYLFGFVGVLVAVPVAAALGVLIRFALRIYLKSPVYSGDSGPPLPSNKTDDHNQMEPEGDGTGDGIVKPASGQHGGA